MLADETYYNIAVALGARGREPGQRKTRMINLVRGTVEEFADFFKYLEGKEVYGNKCCENALSWLSC